MQPRLGMRYGDAWALKPGMLFLEHSQKVVPAIIKNAKAGQTPLQPSLLAATEGIRSCYGTAPVMGTDPEFFLTKAGLPVPAFDFLPDKYTTTDGLFWDGFQAEITVDVLKVSPDCSHQMACRHRCHAILAQQIGKQLQRLVPKGLEIAPRSVWKVPECVLKLAGEAQVGLGCDPSRNAYATSGRCVMDPRQLQWRFAGGHVHFELTAEEREDTDLVRYLVKTLDALLGIPCVLLAQNYDHFIRRRYYGLAGEYRRPPHGLEYRTLSNFWLMHPQAFGLVFDLARHALNVGRARLRNIFVGASQESAIQNTINYCDVRSAKDFMHLNREFYSTWARMQYETDKPFWAAIDGGVDKVIPNWGHNVVQTWKLPEDWYKVPGWRDLR